SERPRADRARRNRPRPRRAPAARRTRAHLARSPRSLRRGTRRHHERAVHLHSTEGTVMTVIAVDKDPKTCTMCITADYDASVERVWRLWSDPRLLERWWGPPSYPATFDTHDLTPGGRVAYHMTGPDGDQPRGWWNVLVVDPPHHLELEDGFADADGNPNSE